MNHKGKSIVLAVCIVLTTMLLVGCVSPAQEHARKGDTYYEQGQFDEAIAEYTEAVNADPDFARAYSNRAAAYCHIEEYDKAIADCSKAIELDPNLAVLYYNRGFAYRLLGKKAKAIADFEKCIELSHDPWLTEAAKQEIEELQSG